VARVNLCSRLSAAADVAEVLTRIDDKRSVGGDPWCRYIILMYYFIHIMYIPTYIICMYEAFGRSVHRTPNARALAINDIGFFGRRWVFIDHLHAAPSVRKVNLSAIRPAISDQWIPSHKNNACSGPAEHNIMYRERILF